MKQIKYTPVELEEGCSKAKIFTRKFISRNYLNLLLWSLAVIIITALYLGGIFTFLLEEDFANYSHSLEIDDFHNLIETIDVSSRNLNTSSSRRFNRAAIVGILSHLENENPKLKHAVPYSQFEGLNYTIDIQPKCQEQWNMSRINKTEASPYASIVLVVKSAVNNYAQRQSIRDSWYQNKTIDDLFTFKTVFMVGACHETNRLLPSTLPSGNYKTWSSEICDRTIRNESSYYGDIIQSSGIDTYYNNTIKIFMTFRWIVERCPSDFLITIDDDFVFEVDNFITYIKSLISDESKVTQPVTGSLASSSLDKKESHRGLHEIAISEQDTRSQVAEPKIINSIRLLSHEYLYTGYLRNYVHPLRSILSKWYVSCNDYAYNRYPPFITGGACLMSFKTVKHFYLASYFASSFRFDDVYVGMLAYKLGVSPVHNEFFMCDIDDYLAAKPLQTNSTNCIGVHDIKPDELTNLWIQRNHFHSKKHIGDP